MEDTRQKIVVNCESLFMKFGVRSITLSDIAARLGISKKTIYQHFPDKESLIEAALRNHLDADICQLRQTLATSPNPIEALLKVFRHESEFLQQTNPAILFELQKYYPKQFGLIESYKQEVVFSSISDNLRMGIRLGLYRPELEVDVLAAYYSEVPEMILKTLKSLQRVGNEKKLHEVYDAITSHFIKGLCTSQGLKILQQCSGQA